MTSARGFTSDNASGAHPAVLAAIAAANEGHMPSYGADPVTAALEEQAREVFGPGATIFPVFNGTGANVVAVQSLLQRWDAVVATEESHMVNDESTAPSWSAASASSPSRPAPGSWPPTSCPLSSTATTAPSTTPGPLP